MELKEFVKKLIDDFGVLPKIEEEDFSAIIRERNGLTIQISQHEIRRGIIGQFRRIAQRWHIVPAIRLQILYQHQQRRQDTQKRHDEENHQDQIRFFCF